MNLVMLTRTAFASYLLLWAQFMRRRVWQSEALDALVATRPADDAGDSSPTARGHSENPPQRAGIRTADLILHVRLAKLVPLLTILCYFVLELIDIFRGTHCRTVAPHIYALTSVIVIVMSCYYCLQFGKMFTLSIWEFRAARRANQPAVRKLSQSTVDRIPLVIYVPTDNRDETAFRWPADSPASVPPRTSAPMAQRKRRFVFFRQVPQASTRHEAGDLEMGVRPPPDARPPYPFVRLPAQQVMCTICLCEFEGPPQAVDPAVPSGAARDRCERSLAVTSGTSHVNDDEEAPVDPQNVGNRFGGRASEGGTSTGPEPLRLLGCGHAYHKGCIDPWLTGQSGRCPYCQAAVEVPV
ncbi:hypothetical protein BD413DRAFT_797 [Trametes elegans]|nr:hypothetical protein BD413DRAFT_797 [Trametes elegans]